MKNPFDYIPQNRERREKEREAETTQKRKHEQQLLKRRLDAARKFDSQVCSVLRQLRDAAYPKSKIVDFKSWSQESTPSFC